ncbi:Aste57867_3148 [Aphanomyces stellatus]|uniref:Aste57867_3148 protein n=1 Tax=Aphanomyces stellatus TaxID=120398 RepID=A0A485K945_9STRA|nr:hypothetical protein As57867_003139 [Aphanomyces stellatus]VFT80322.1 Aste57867_3148 [Aphanomyces stellatus]
MKACAGLPLVVAALFCSTGEATTSLLNKPFDPHENMHLQHDAPKLVKLKKGFDLPKLDVAAFDPHVNLETIEKKYEKMGIMFDDVAPLKPRVFAKAIVDHFAKKKSAHWEQRYYLNDEYWGGPGFPVFLMIGYVILVAFVHDHRACLCRGEAPIQPSDVSHEMFYMNTLAIEHKALLVSLEHRFYGESYPAPDMSVDSLALLSIPQALADVVVFHAHLTKKHGLGASKWVAFGGSYPGNLAVWLKAEYPDLVVGAIASSAPIQLVADFQEYMAVVSDSITRVGGAECGHAIEAAMQALDDAIVDVLAHPTKKKKKKTKGLGGHTLYDVMPVCEPLTNEMDAMVLESIVKGQFQGIVQYNDFDPINIKATCKYFKSVEAEKPLVQLAGYMSMASPGYCLMSTFSGTAASMLNQTAFAGIEFDGKSTERQWTYQRCTELGATQSGGPPLDTIFKPLQFTTFKYSGKKVCEGLFGKGHNFNNLDAINEWLGGNRPATQNVTFLNGNVDPWYPMGLLDKANLHDESNTVVVIDGTAHCRDMYAPQVNDTKAIQNAQRIVAENVQLYLS